MTVAHHWLLSKVQSRSQFQAFWLLDPVESNSFHQSCFLDSTHKCKHCTRSTENRNTILDGEAAPLEAAEAARGIPDADDYFQRRTSTCNTPQRIWTHHI